ncbi:cytochrome P450 [Conidiobolus coronatus NRRL 28638]|uniref:Cytochrome P450 n=1 Tax=Conidiobolus coronatus (strain ATCC 28846 / CBS 209.66 / NRRL 28638) TaxID=796925 RepID=A0A137NUT8_CONC2|nr:cytochrome P450 [Conidiobolus coronatus NRRL 28638]|eukprot:KXN66516.1 cytochrome P450 [Conidiobolus coronatus NRRL 28638]
MQKEFQPLIDEHGVIRVFTHLGWTLFIGSPSACKEISNKPDIFTKPSFEDAKISRHLTSFFGKSQVVSNNGDEWKRHRKVINPIFTQSWSTQLFGACAHDLINGWEKQVDKDVKVHDLIQRMTLDVFGRAIFDIDFKAVKDPDSKLFHLYNDITEEMFSNPLYILIGFLDDLPYIGRTKLENQIKKYHEFVEEMLNLRSRELKEGKSNNSQNLITSFLKSNEKEDESKLTMDEIRDNITIFILAGHDTTSNTLASTLYYLARYPEIQDKLRSEVLEVLGNPSELTVPTIDQLKNMPYMDLVNKESMRIMTTASSIQRDTFQTHTLSNGLTIPKSTPIFLHLWGIHHNSKAFPNPFEFNPDRFKDMGSEESRNWQPFLTGIRSCIGTTFSLMEQRVTIAMLLQKFEFSITNSNPDYDKLRITASGIVRPRDLHLHIKSRA